MSDYSWIMPTVAVAVGSGLAALRFAFPEEQWRRMVSIGLQLDYADSHHRHVSTLATLRLTLLEAQWRRMVSVGLQLDYADSRRCRVSTLATPRLALLEVQWRRMVSVGLQLDYAGSRHRREQRLGRAVDHLAGGAMEVSGGWRYFAVQ